MTDPTLASIARAQDKTLIIVENLAEKVAERIEHTDAWRDRTDLILMGDGNGRKGHNVRIDRLEQANERQRWLTRLMMGALVLSILNAVLDVI